MQKVTKEQKHLALNTADLGKCFMMLEDVLEVCPSFVPKRLYEKMDDKGKLTKEHYVKCKHVKESISDEAWKEIKSEIVYDWFKLGREGDVRLILVNKKGGTMAVASSSAAGENYAKVSSDDGSSVKAEVILPDGKKLTAEIGGEKYNLTGEQLLELATQIKIKNPKKKE